MAYAVAEGKKIENCKVQLKGDPERLGTEVPRRFPQVLGGQALPPDEKGSGRRELADWIASPDNPLTARVMVNRLWHHHFGRGLVATPNDFGKQGQAAHAPRAARLARPAVHRERLVGQGDAPADSDVADVSTGERQEVQGSEFKVQADAEQSELRTPNSDCCRSRQRAAVALPASPARCGVDSRYAAGAGRQSRSVDRRGASVPAAEGLGFHAAQAVQGGVRHAIAAASI